MASAFHLKNNLNPYSVTEIYIFKNCCSIYFLSLECKRTVIMIVFEIINMSVSGGKTSLINTSINTINSILTKYQNIKQRCTADPSILPAFK